MRRHHQHHHDQVGREAGDREFSERVPAFGGPPFDRFGGGPGGRGPGFGLGGPGGGPGFRGGPGGGPGGPGGPRGRGRGRARGNVRAAVIALLLEDPRHGYALITEIAERSEGLWRPSPGSVYPLLQQLQDEGLISVEESEGRRVFTLTDAGKAWAQEHAEELTTPWSAGQEGPLRRGRQLHQQLSGLGAAAGEVARNGDETQVEQAVAVLDEARRALYRILAGDAPASPRPETPPAE